MGTEQGYFAGYFNPDEGMDLNDLIKVLPDQSCLVYGVDHYSSDGFCDTVAAPVFLQPDPGQCVTVDPDSQEDCDFSDVVLGFINQILMEEEEEDLNERGILEDKENQALVAAEKSLYEAIGKVYPDSEVGTPSTQSVDGYVAESPTLCGYRSCSSSSPVEPLEKVLNAELNDYQNPNVSSVASSQSSLSSNSSAGSVGDGFAASPFSPLGTLYILDGNHTLRQYGSESNQFSNLGYSASFIGNPKDVLVVKGEEKTEPGYSNPGFRSKKNASPKDDYLEEQRNSKMTATSSESVLRSKMFDMVLLNEPSTAKRESALREALLNEANKNVQLDVQPKGGKARGKKTKIKRDLVDLRSLLTICAQAVAANDQRGSMELLKQIRQHSSETGDGMQRMAHYFANGLEARLAGSGTPRYRTILFRHRSAADLLKAYHMYLAISPFRKMSNFFANKTIMQVAESKTQLHIIDFGIMFGFQWPCLIQRLSARPGGPPKIRITGIEFPQPGFKPAEKVEETGRRLANYAESFNVHFEYNPIAKEWETITLEDLKIRDDEVLVVNCLFNMRNVLDECVKVDSPRNAVMKLIQKANPTIYIQGVVNGTYNAPFFISRFREAIFHYSSLFDMLDTNIPRDIPERLLLEKEIFGREVINVVACEGSERSERPETYKQWQVRNLRAGLVPLPLNEEIMRMAKDRVKSCYHKDFMIGEDGNWLIQGWKGRINYALSSWKPAN